MTATFVDREAAADHFYNTSPRTVPDDYPGSDFDDHQENHDDDHDQH